MSNKGAQEKEPSMSSSQTSFRLIIDQPPKVAQAATSSANLTNVSEDPCNAYPPPHAHKERTGRKADTAREANDIDEVGVQENHAAGRSSASPGNRSFGQTRIMAKVSETIKRPLSAYNMYFKVQRRKLLAEGVEENTGHVSFADLAKIIGKQWKEIDDEEREKYEQMANEDSARCRAAMDAYNTRIRKQNQYTREETTVPNHVQHDIDSRHLSRGQFVTNTQDLPMKIHFSFPLTSPLQVSGPGSILTTKRHREKRQDHIMQHHLAVSFPDRPEYSRHPTMVLWAQTSAVKVSGSVAAPSATDVLPVPHGAHVMLPDHTGTQRLHVVQYKYCRVTKRTAHEYIRVLQQPVSMPVDVSASRVYGSWFDTSREVWRSVDSFDSEGLRVDHHSLYPSRSTDSAYMDARRR